MPVIQRELSFVEEQEIIVEKTGHGAVRGQGILHAEIRIDIRVVQWIFH